LSSLNHNVKLPFHLPTVGRTGLLGHGVASEMRTNEISILIMPLDPAYPASGGKGHLIVNVQLPNDK
jgi:hypothetical protein